jgi:CHAD domain-containing protein
VAKQSEIRGLTPEDTTRDAAVKTIWTLFDDMWRFRDDVLQDRDIEAVHDMRVASRRLRTAMQTFRPCFSGARAREHYRRIKGLADLLGEVRDRDVLLEELERDAQSLVSRERDGIADLVKTVKTERALHHAALLKLLKKLDGNAYDRAFLAYFGRKLS